MSNFALNSGKHLETIFDNINGSITGPRDPHITAFSKFLFCDLDAESFLELKKFYINSSKVDVINIFYCLAVHMLENNVDDESVNFSNVLKNSKFTNKASKKALKDFSLFVKKPTLINLNKLKDNQIHDDFINLIISIGFKSSSLNISNTFELFPDLNNYFNFSEEGLITINDPSNFNDCTNHFGLFIIFFINKFYFMFSAKDLNFILDNLIKNNVFDGFLLHLFLIKNFELNDFKIDFFVNLSNQLQYLPNRYILSLSQYPLLSYFLNNDYSNIKIWFNQFTNKINNNELSVDLNGFIDWDIEDNHFEPVSYHSSQLNSRFYINSIHHLSLYREKVIDLFQDNNEGEQVNVFGGSHALSFSNLKNKNFYSNVLFHYNDRFNSLEKLFSLSTRDKLYLDNIENKNIFIFDFEVIKNFNTNDFIITLFDSIKDNCCPSNLYFFSTPLPSLTSYNYFDINNVSETLNLFNDDLKKFSAHYGFNFIDTNSFLDTSTGFIKSDDLLCDYFIKPDVIYKIINEHVI